MDAVVELVMDLANKLIGLLSAGDKEAERKAMLAIARRAMDEAAKRELA